MYTLVYLIQDRGQVPVSGFQYTVIVSACEKGMAL